MKGYLSVRRYRRTYPLPCRNTAITSDVTKWGCWVLKCKDCVRLVTSIQHRMERNKESQHPSYTINTESFRPVSGTAAQPHSSEDHHSH